MDGLYSIIMVILFIVAIDVLRNGGEGIDNLLRSFLSPSTEKSIRTEPLNDYELSENLKDELDELYSELAVAKEDVESDEIIEGIVSRIKIREIMLSKLVDKL